MFRSTGLSPPSTRCNVPSVRIVPVIRTRNVKVLAASPDTLIRGISENGQVSVMVADATALVADATSRHRTAPTASAALGRALIGGLLMGSNRKAGETLQINVNGRGPIGLISVIADWQGNVKGMVGNPLADPPLKANGKLDVAAAVGRGSLSVIRSIPYQKEPYTGVVPIHSGEIAEDLAYYMADSEQTQSALALGVSLAKDTSVRHAGGFLVSVLPFAEDETLNLLEKNLASIPSMTDMLGQGMTPTDIAAKLLEGLGLSEGVETMVPQYGPCDEGDLKQRMKRAVATIGNKEIQSILEDEGKIEVKCEFCQCTVVFSEEDVRDVMQMSASDAA